MTELSTLKKLWFDFLQVVTVPSFTLGFSFRYEGSAHVPMTGPTLIIANHQSFLDPLLVGMAVPRRLTYLARKTLFRNRAFAAMIRTFNAVPIDQDGLGKEGLQTVMAHLGRGKGILVFPEGSRTPDGVMQPLKPGIHLIIQRAPALILPVGIAGAYDAWPMWRPYPIPAPLFWPANKGTIAVAIGRPFDSRPFAAMPRKEAMAALFSEMDKVQRRAEQLRRR